MENEINHQKYFHFTIGPVQGFVAQARRTRDFWAGSFLLSWLAGVAMLAVKQQNEHNTILFPLPDDDYLQWLNGAGSSDPPRQGSIPNRFKAQVQDGFKPEQVVATVKQAWSALAQHVWNKDHLDCVATEETKIIWRRQNEHFWEINWVLTADSDANTLLNQRKNWRSHLPLPEAGDKCHLMEGWQELSGVVAMDKTGNDNRRAFWQKIRDSKISGIANDIAETEQLCTLAYVKRRFMRHFDSFSATINGVQLKGWKLSTGMPSTNYMAAVHWLELLLISSKDGAKELNQLLDAGRVLVENNEWDIRIPCLDKASDKDPVKRKITALDGGLFFEHVRDNTAVFADRAQVQDFECALKQLEKQLNLSEKAPAPFYAVLLMDGDSLGTQISKSQHQTPISNALKQFTQDVSGVIRDNNGFLIYAGGDDVLALLPLEDALPCALACRKIYTQAFCDEHAKNSIKINTTISGAVVYAHVKVALREVLRQAHHTLDDIAKQQAGRDAIAIKILKPGGEHACWAQPWEVALDASPSPLALEQIADNFREADDVERAFSSRFFYRIRERFQLLAESLDEDQQLALLAADYLASEPAQSTVRDIEAAKVVIKPLASEPAQSTVRDIEAAKAVIKPLASEPAQSTVRDIEAAKAVIKPLIKQCTPHQRVVDKHAKVTYIKRQPTADAALVVRFLAHKGREVR